MEETVHPLMYPENYILVVAGSGQQRISDIREILKIAGGTNVEKTDRPTVTTKSWGNYWERTGRSRLDFKLSPCSVRISTQVFGHLDTGFWSSRHRFLAISTQVFGHLDTGFWSSRHRFFLVSLGPRANAEMVPAFPSCLYMLLM
jgi:hypothetical protein